VYVCTMQNDINNTKCTESMNVIAWNPATVCTLMSVAQFNANRTQQIARTSGYIVTYVRNGREFAKLFGNLLDAQTFYTNHQAAKNIWG
jgi:hypothetical protein